METDGLAVDAVVSTGVLHVFQGSVVRRITVAIPGGNPTQSVLWSGSAFGPSKHGNWSSVSDAHLSNRIPRMVARIGTAETASEDPPLEPTALRSLRSCVCGNSENLTYSVWETDRMDLESGLLELNIPPSSLSTECRPIHTYCYDPGKQPRYLGGISPHGHLWIQSYLPKSTIRQFSASDPSLQCSDTSYRGASSDV